ncbi:hypothetical protein D3C80_856280 [compost metagenome]
MAGVVAVDAFCFELLDAGHEALAQGGIQLRTRSQARSGDGLHNGDDVELQGDGAEHLGQRLAAGDADAFVLQGRRQVRKVRAGLAEALRPEARGVVVLHQQAQWLALLVHQHRVLLVGFQRDAVAQPEPQMDLQQHVQVVLQPMLQRPCVEALDQLLEEQPAIGQRAGQRRDRH